jgi:hypothetical protein
MERKSFCLAELMIAIGIMAIGLIMAATLFPAAIREHSRSARSVMGTIISENALETVMATLKHPLQDNSGTIVEADMLNCTEKVQPPEVRRYPAGSADTKFGFLVFARVKTEDKNDYILSMVSFCKSDKDNTIEAIKLTGVTIPSGDKTFDISGYVPSVGDRYRIIGSPVIAPSGYYATIIGIDGDNAVLDHTIIGVDSVNPWIIVEKSGAAFAGTRSPALIVFMTRMALPTRPAEKVPA